MTTSNKKMKTAFFCKECGYESSKWLGQCPNCHAWNTMVEAPLPAKTKGSAATVSRGGSFGLSDERRRPVSLSEITESQEQRWNTGYTELDRVLGGGIVTGSLVLVGGDPGIGKSTLLLQVTRNLARDGRNILYISGEESLYQIKLRAKRIGDVPDNLKFMCETDLDTITEILLETKPELCVIDSIQTMFNPSVDASAGSVSQIRETTGVLLRLAKQTGITFFIIGHVTKEGTVAGPRILEHMVDTVLYFEGDKYASYRIIRGIKNRFGSTNEIGVFEMRPEGLAEVANPSEYMLSGRPEGASGSIVSCTIDGTRAMLTEVQALVCRSNFGFPKRQATGTDYNRVSLLMAVLEKRLGLPLSEYDAYVNLAGGMRQTEPALDLGMAMAIISSYRNKTIDDKTIAFGEVGLSGEVRMVHMADVRIAEAARMGFTTCILPASNLKGIHKPANMNLVGVRNLQEAAEVLS